MTAVIMRVFHASLAVNASVSRLLGVQLTKQTCLFSFFQVQPWGDADFSTRHITSPDLLLDKCAFLGQHGGILSAKDVRINCTVMP